MKEHRLSPSMILIILLLSFSLSSCEDGKTGNPEDYLPFSYTPNHVFFDPNGGTGIMEPQETPQDTIIRLNKNTFTREGHIFVGWATNPNIHVEYHDEGFFCQDHVLDETLYAIWQYTATTLETLSPESTRLIDMNDVATLNENGYLQQHDDTPYIQEHPGYFTHQISPFTIGAYEVTYELWYTVKTWAQGNGYSFSDSGTEGSEGTPGATPSLQALHPVTRINWQNVVVWCNAYNELSGKDPMYCKDENFLYPIKSPSRWSSLETLPGNIDNPYVNWNSNGYRLPTEGEWLYAATCANKYDNQMGVDEISTIDDVAWYAENTTTTQPAGTKTANAFGIYDLCGNVAEWCHDWDGDLPSDSTTNYQGPSEGTERILQGGSWSTDRSSLPERTALSPISSFIWNTGFRLVISNE